MNLRVTTFNTFSLATVPPAGQSIGHVLKELTTLLDMISQQRYNNLGTKHQQKKKHDTRTAHKTAVQPFIIMLQFVHVCAFSNFGFNGKTPKYLGALVGLKIPKNFVGYLLLRARNSNNFMDLRI